MKRTLTIAEARKFFESEKVFATNDGGFLFNDQGKYCSGLTFVVSSSFELDKDGKVVDPIKYVSDREVTDSFNLDLDGDASILFGDFWRSQKGAPCFRPKDPAKAKHILVCVSWGGCFNSRRGYYGDAVKERGATYFRRARSNGGGAGYDYWVLPVGYVHQLDTNVYRIDWETARAYCAKHSKLQAEQRAEADRLYKEKLAIEAASRQSKELFAPRLEEIEAELSELRERYSSVPQIILGEESFKLGWKELSYSQKSLNQAEKELIEQRDWVAEFDAKAQAKQRAYAEFAPVFEALRDRAHAVNLEVVISDQDKAVLKALGLYGSGSHILEKDYSYKSVESFDKKIREREAELEIERLKAAKVKREIAAKAAGLPSDVRIWKCTGSRTGCSKGWVIREDGTDRGRDRLHNDDSRQADRYDEGYEIWNQILPGELVIQWTKSCTAAEHVCSVIHQPEQLSEAQLERVAEIQQELEAEWEGLTGLASGDPSPSIGEGWLSQLTRA